jgi:hypothetical protein
MQDDKTLDNKKADQKAPNKKRSIMDNPKQRRLFERMGVILSVTIPDNTEGKK